MNTKAFFIGFSDSQRVNNFVQKNSFIGNFELIPATDGRNFPLCFLEMFFSESFFKHQMQRKSLPWLGGTAGCFLSHIKAIEIAKLSDADYVIVAEDDAVFRQDPNLLISEMMQNNVDLLYLNDRMRPKQAGNSSLVSSRILVLTDENLSGTGAESYILSKVGINAVLNMFSRGLKNRMPTGYDGFLQSFAIRQGKVAQAPGRKSLNDWVKLRRGSLFEKSLEIKVGIALPTLAAHSDKGKSIING